MDKRTFARMAVGLAVVTSLAACGSGTDAGADGGAVEADVAAAEAELQPYIDAPADFYVTEPLTKRPEGMKLAILDCGTPICSLMADLLTPPAEMLGMEATEIQTGMSADGIGTAFDTVIADGYDAVYVPALAFPLWEAKYDELKEAGVVVAVAGVTGLPDDIDIDIAGEGLLTTTANLLADWVVAQGEDAYNSAIYLTPEQPFQSVVVEKYKERMAELCPDCTVRTPEIPVAAIGGNSAQIVVDDLTANPDTTTVVFPAGQQAIGLPSALKVAGIDVKTMMALPPPAQLADVQNGDLDAALASDFMVQMWSVADSLARVLTGEPLSAGVAEDKSVIQVLDADNLKGVDVSTGFHGYPDVPERFQKLWAQAS